MTAQQLFFLGANVRFRNETQITAVVDGNDLLRQLNANITDNVTVWFGTTEFSGIKAFYAVYVYWPSSDNDYPQYSFGYLFAYGGSSYKIGTREYVPYSESF